MRAKACIRVSRPIEDVFEYVVDVAKMPRWMTGVQSASLLDPAMTKGARYALEYTGGWRPYELEVIVTELERPRVFASQVTRGPFAFEGTMTFADVDGATEITNSIEAGPDSLASRIAGLLFGWMLRGSMRRRLLGELEALQRSIEGDSSVKT